MSLGRARKNTCSPNSSPSSRLGLPKSCSKAARPSWPTKCLREELPGMLDEPEHYRVVDWDLPLDHLLQRQHQ
eukprot:6743013-Alexandrium_andersonii.AAC.1